MTDLSEFFDLDDEGFPMVLRIEVVGAGKARLAVCKKCHTLTPAPGSHALWHVHNRNRLPAVYG